MQTLRNWNALGKEPVVTLGLFVTVSRDSVASIALIFITARLTRKSNATTMGRVRRMITARVLTQALLASVMTGGQAANAIRRFCIQLVQLVSIQSQFTVVDIFFSSLIFQFFMGCCGPREFYLYLLMQANEWIVF
jgi:hypothetical protein